MAPSDEKEKILVVDDSPSTLEILQRNLSAEGYRVFTATGVAAAIEILEKVTIDLVVTDMKMPKVSGFDLVRHVRENCSDTEVMMITGFATVKGAVEALKTGAAEYLSKPFTDEELFSAVKRALDLLHMRRAARTPSQWKLSSPYGIIGECQAMRKVFKAIDKAASTHATVLITGESGTGKELVARAIHYSSTRASTPFVPVNCGGIPEGLLESELFGHVKGAFTGATETRAGFFLTADGGTIFLDEISETSLSMQVKLLRVLQDKEVCLVGNHRPRKVDVRIIASTNKDLAGLVKKDFFREDVYFRLNVLTITLPPLRKRGKDIFLLAHHFARKSAKEYDKPIPKISEKAVQVLKKYDWPGNVRELENLVLRLTVMMEGDTIDIPDLPSHMRFSAPREGGWDRSLEEVEGEYVRNVLANVDGNKTKAAAILGLDRKTLRKKLEKLKDRESDSL